MLNAKLAVRSLLKTPFITAIAILSLALGIGANAAIYSIFDQAVLEALPVAEPARLVNLVAPGPKPGGATSCSMAGRCAMVLSHPMLRDLQAAEGTGFQGLAGHRSFGANIAQGERTVDGTGMLVTGSYFGVLGLRPALGRLLQPEDDAVVGGEAVAVLGHRFWRVDLGADPGVVGRTLVVNGTRLSVVGVAPEGFTGTTLGIQPDVYVPMRLRPAVYSGRDHLDNRRAYWVYAFGRLAPGVTVDQAEAGINRVYSAIINEVEAPLQEGMSDETLARFRGKRLVLEPGRQGQSRIHATVRTPLLLLFGITGLVLLIACANIANLFMARGVQRSTELAVRRSMGATRPRLLRQLLVEALILAGVGGAAALAVAQGTLLGITELLPPDQTAMLELTVHGDVVVFAALAAFATGLLVGVYPAYHATRGSLIGPLKSSGQTSGARSTARFRWGLVTAQVALSMALLVAAGLFIKSLANVSRVELGIRTENLVTFRVRPVLNGYEPERRAAFFERLESELRAVPGVTGTTSAMIPILAHTSSGTRVAVQGFQGGPDADQSARYNRVGADYFGTMGMGLLAGRDFDRADGPEAPRVAVVNEAFAEKFGLSPDEVVGSFMSLDADASGSELDIEIVGLVRDTKYDRVKSEIEPQFFTPHRQRGALGSLSFYVRTAGDVEPVLRAIPGVVRSLDPELPIQDLQTMEVQVRQAVFMDRLVSVLSTAFAVLATLLAAIGLYGVLAYTVARRTREFGLRMALGADGGRVRRMVVVQVGRTLLVGGALGVLAALALGRAAGSILFGLSGHDPFVLVAATTLLAGVALGAGYLPALRASRIDPMEALRHE